MTIEHTTADARTLTETQWVADPADDFFGAPFVDIDEWRDSPTKHRHVHGGFSGTDARFSFYFPERGVYEGRFFQHVTPVPQSENLAPLVHGDHNKITFAVDSGAYFVETNGGGPDAANPFSGMDPTIGAYRVNAAAARFSRTIAATIFGDHRPFGYLYGGSGGAYRTIGASESTRDVWDGFAPYVPGSPMSIPNVFSARMHAQRVLRDRFPQIVDAHDIGGDPSSLDLTPAEAEAFAEVTRMGFPPRSWFGWQTMGMHAFSVLYPGVMAADPTFAEDFWSVGGYLGADPASSVHRDRVQLATTIVEIVTDERPDDDLTAGGVDESFLHTAPRGGTVQGVRLSHTPDGWMLGAQLRVVTGTAAGATIQILEIEGDTASFEPGQDALTSGLTAGDEVVLDNSGFLAAQTYHRHQVPGPEYRVWDQFRDGDGAPIHPQRPMLLGPLFTQGAAGTLPTGDITGKMIVVACLLDREAFPWQADWYRSRVEEHLGSSTHDRFRLWFIDNALHGDDDEQEFPDRSVSYLGALETALRQLVAWVEHDTPPAASSAYRVEDGQISIPPTMADRAGIQPVVSLTVNGSTQTTVRPGERFEIRLDVDAPAGGTVVEVRPDFSASGHLGDAVEIEPASTVAVEATGTFEKPGTYFVSARASAQSDGDATTPHARVQNLARARVVVRD